MAPETAQSVFVVSDSTGKTAGQILASALVQFPGPHPDVILRPNVHTVREIRLLAKEAAKSRSLVLHTLVCANLRTRMLQECRLRGVDSMDLMGPLLDRLSLYLHRTPREQPGLYRHLPEGKSREIEAVEFAFRHDDGQNSHELERAEIVLVGVSRTMKTPTMLYLAYHGWFCANVALVPQLPLPEALLQVPASAVFCLDVNEIRLLEMRRSRAAAFNLPHDSYASLAQVRAELAFSRDLSIKYGWTVIDTTGKSVEEAAREILTLHQQRATRPPPR